MGSWTLDRSSFSAEISEVFITYGCPQCSVKGGWPNGSLDLLCALFQAEVKLSESIAFSNRVVYFISQGSQHDLICVGKYSSEVLNMVCNGKLESGCEHQLRYICPKLSKLLGGRPAP